VNVLFKHALRRDLLSAVGKLMTGQWYNSYRGINPGLLVATYDDEIVNDERVEEHVPRVELEADGVV